MPVILNVVPLEGRKYKVFHDLCRRRQLTVVVFHVSLDVCEVCCTQREITSHGLHPKRRALLCVLMHRLVTRDRL